MPRKLKDFHHFKGNDLGRSEKVEKKVIELLLNSKLSDNERESSKIWELLHLADSCQMARILAEKRKLNIEISETASNLHDIHVIVKGNYKDHAKQGGLIAKKILQEIGGFSDSEIKIISEAVSHHSEKEVYSGDPYVELIKDVDVFVCSLYKNAEGFYRLHKPKHIFDDYVNRIKRVREELGLSATDVFRE